MKARRTPYVMALIRPSRWELVLPEAGEWGLVWVLGVIDSSLMALIVFEVVWRR